MTLSSRTVIFSWENFVFINFWCSFNFPSQHVNYCQFCCCSSCLSFFVLVFYFIFATFYDYFTLPTVRYFSFSHHCFPFPFDFGFIEFLSFRSTTSTDYQHSTFFLRTRYVNRDVDNLPIMFSFISILCLLSFSFSRYYHFCCFFAIFLVCLVPYASSIFGFPKCSIFLLLFISLSFFYYFFMSCFVNSTT